MTTEDLITYYKNLLILQYYRLSRARATIGAFVQELIASQIINQVQDGFDLETAIGKQLNILASYVGAQRNNFGLILLKSILYS